MAKRKFTFTNTEQKELLQAYRRCNDAATGTRYQEVRMYDESCPEEEMNK